jgi:hypothetical protein
MALTTVAVRCPRCGTDLRVAVAPAPPTQWFPCPHCRAPLPVVVPRDPPPLYSWEVLPGLYPVLGRPRAPRWRTGPVVAVALALVVASSAAVIGILAFYGATALGPAEYSVSGSVGRTVGGVCCTPAAGATIVLTDDSGAEQTQSVSPLGTFAFLDVPAGGISINVTLPGYAPVTVRTFASPVYTSGVTGLGITLVPGGAENGTTVDLTPFASLEDFVAAIGGGIGLLAVAGAVAGGAILAGRRTERPALAVVGGAAGVAIPVAFYLLGLAAAFPMVVAGGAVAAGFGAFALTISAANLAMVTPAASPD